MSDPAAVVLGARNLGGAIAAHLDERGWQVAAVSRSEGSLEGVRERGLVGITADAADPQSLAGALAEARARFGRLDLVVNAVSAARPGREGGPFGGGPLAEAELADFRGWTAAVAEQGFVFLSEGIRAMRAAGSGGTLVQMTGGSSRRGMPGRGLWAAGAFAQRAMVQAAAQELREEAIHVAMLAVDATIESPKTAAYTKDTPRKALADMQLVAEAVEFLANQRPRGYTHELSLTPAGERWVP
jgi:NAD(P)-dependent dehydrogenase (short-subunit alcohol dehydrogenase family)